MDELRAVCRAPTKTCFPDAPLRSGNRPKPQHWKSDESTEVEETSAQEDQDWDDDSDADWTIDSESRSSLSGGSECALVASDGQASLRRSTSETDLLVSEEEVNQTFRVLEENLVGITGLCGPVVDELLLADVRDHGWDTGQYLSEVLVAGFEESERKTSEAYRKVFARARLETCVLFAVNAFWATLSGRVATVSTVLVSQRGSRAGARWSKQATVSCMPGAPWDPNPNGGGCWRVGVGGSARVDGLL